MSNMVTMTETNVASQTGAESDEKLAYRLPAAAKLMDIEVWTLRGLIKAGKIRHRKVGKYFIVSRSEIERFLEEDEQKTA